MKKEWHTATKPLIVRGADLDPDPSFYHQAKIKREKH
jgi:hypothetical protein